jgi:hypothetical protein
MFTFLQKIIQNTKRPEELVFSILTKDIFSLIC